MLLSRLCPVRPHTPFYRLAAHRVPTLWVLYRGLLRASPSPTVRLPHPLLYCTPDFCLISYRCAHTYKYSSAIPAILRVPLSQRLYSRGVIGCGQHPVVFTLVAYHEQWLDAFHKAKQGDEHLCSVLERFGRLICARRVNERMRRIVNDSLVRHFPFPFQPLNPAFI